MTASATASSARVAAIVFAVALGAVLVAIITVSAWVGIRAVLAYAHLRAAQEAATTVRESLTDPAAAVDAVTGITADTAAAHALTSDPVWLLAEGLPWAGPQLAAVADVAQTLDGLTGTALEPLADAAAGFDVDGMQPGRIDLAPIAGMTSAATTATAGIAEAEASVAAIDRGPLLPPVRDAVEELDRLLGEAAGATDTVARLTAALPTMFGSEQPRHYLLLFQNNAEWRSLGGIPGAMALLRVENGSLSLVGQASTSDYRRFDQTVLPLDPEVEQIYGRRPGLFIQNVTLVPDFPTSAALAREMWAREHDGQQVDGVMTLDPVSLSYLLNATGPVTLPTGDVLTSKTAVKQLLNEPYLRYEDPREQDAYFAAAAATVFGSLTAGEPKAGPLLKALVRAAAERRLMLWSAHEAEQSHIAGTPLAGTLPVSDADVARFGVFVNDGTGSKMDYYQSLATTVGWDACVPADDGAATGDATLTVTVKNSAPADAASLPAYITGDGAFGVPAGITRTVGYIYLPEGFELVGAEMTDGSGFGGGTHAGRRVLSFTVDLAPGASVTAVVTARATSPVAPTVEAQATPTIKPQATFAATCDFP
ncbi:DUF4012 domain-containing protein [Microbacterium atlanticum]|uniref:DUF4012 domain-containing protein n=1 Tax=Microbacterium atlanticum TaxID=2782168 RepID=UPI001E46F142|nr:DUF4012 domain-containing protein [Microbacterium atlanticum]